MSEQAESNVVEFDELKLPTVEYGVTEAQIAEVAERYKDPDASTDEGYDHCKEGVKTLTAMRTAVETRRLGLKRPVTAWIAENIDGRAKSLIRQIRAAEGPVRTEKERVDEVKQTEARKAAEAEQARVDDIKDNIEKISATAREQNPNDTASDYQQHITWLTELAITEEVFGEFIEDAKTARDAALFKLTQWHEQAVQREADDKRRADEQAEIDAQKETLKAAQKKIDDDAAALQKKQDKAAEAEAATKKADEEKAAQEQRERDEAEERRVAKITELLNDLASFGQHASDSASIRDAIRSLKNREITKAEFTENTHRAAEIKANRLEAMAATLIKVEEQEERQRKDEEARLPDRDKLIRWCDALEAIPEPEVLNDKAQKLLKRYAGDLSKFTGKLRSDIGKL